MRGIEISGLSGAGKTYLLSCLKKSDIFKLKFLNRRKYYNSIFVKIITIPFSLFFFRKTIIEIYRNEKTKNPKLRFFFDYLKLFIELKKMKNNKLSSAVYIIYTSTIDKILFFFLRMMRTTIIVDEGSLQKAAGLILRDPNIRQDIISSELFLSRDKKVIHLVVLPKDLDIHNEMINKRKRKNNAIKKWADEKFSYEDLVEKCLVFFYHIIEKKPEFFIKFENNYNEKSVELFKDLIFKKLNNKKIIFIS